MTPKEAPPMTTDQTVTGTVIGYEAEPSDVDTVTADLEEFADDPMVLYARASAMQALHQGVVERCADWRARAAQALAAEGRSLQQIADLFQLSRPRAQKLVERGREWLTLSAEAWGVDPEDIDPATGRVRRSIDDLLRVGYAEYAEAVGLAAESSEQDIQRIADGERAEWRSFRDAWCRYGVELVDAESSLRHIRGELAR